MAAKTIEQATVAELDALAAEHNVPEYPAEGLKAEKYEAVANALGEGFEFESVDEAEEPMVELKLADPDDNAAQFGYGDRQIEIVQGEGVDVPERDARRLVAAHSFLKVDD